MKTYAIAAASAVAIFTVWAGHPATAALIWHSALDGDAMALVGSNGIPTGAPAAVSDLNGNPGGAVLFDGATQYFDIGDLGAFSAGTISAWVRSENNSGERGAVAAGRSGGGADVYFTMMQDGNGRIRVDLDDGAVRRDALNNAALTEGTWYHVTTTWSADGVLRVYQDGVLQTDTQSLSGDFDPYDMTGNGLVGAERFGDRFWQGAIDDVRIYNHQLSGAEITPLFDAGPLYSVIPEPGGIVLAAVGAMALVLVGWRRLQSS